MIIFGRDIRFKKTIGALCMVAENCRDKDITNLAILLDNGTTSEKLLARAMFIVALHNGYEEYTKLENPDYEGTPLTIEEVMLLDEEPFNEAFNEAVQAWLGEKPTIEVEEPKKKAKRKAVTSD